MTRFADAPPADNNVMQPDFYIFTAGMTVDESAGFERPTVRMIGSSTEQDLHKDTMTISALQDMVAAPPGLLIWLNHDYTVPDSLFGSLNEQPMLISKGGFTDLHIAVEVELENPAAAKTFRYIQKRRRLGCSIGCSVEDYKLVDQPDDSPLVHITRVRPVEWSVVGIPANQRSWVENGARGIFHKQLWGERSDHDIEQMASIVKSLFPTEFSQMIDSAPTHFRTLKGVKARKSTNKRILWEPESKKFFLASGGERTDWREIPRTDDALESVRKGVFGSTGSSVSVPTVFTPGVNTAPMSTITITGADGNTYSFTGNQASLLQVPNTIGSGAVSGGYTLSSTTPAEPEPDLFARTAKGWLAGRSYDSLTEDEKDSLAQYVALILSENGE